MADIRSNIYHGITRKGKQYKVAQNYKPIEAYAQVSLLDITMLQVPDTI